MLDRVPLPDRDMMSKVFDKKAHEAYERRAKNDKMVNLITSKFHPEQDELEQRNKLAKVYQE